jgi:hypothetical protein
MGFLGEADQGPDVHEALIEWTRFLIGKDGLGQLPEEVGCLGLCRTCLEGIEPTKEPPDIAIQNGGTFSIGKGEYRPGCAPTDARKG